MKKDRIFLMIFGRWRRDRIDFAAGVRDSVGLSAFLICCPVKLKEKKVPSDFIEIVSERKKGGRTTIRE